MLRFVCSYPGCEGILFATLLLPTQFTVSLLRCIAVQGHGLQGVTPRNRIPIEHQRAVVDFALKHATVNPEQQTLHVDTRCAGRLTDGLTVPQAYAVPRLLSCTTSVGSGSCTEQQRCAANGGTSILALAQANAGRRGLERAPLEGA